MKGLIVGMIAFASVLAACEKKEPAPTPARPAAQSNDSVKAATDQMKESGAKAVESVKEGVSKAAAVLSDEARKAAETYLGDLAEATKLLAGLKGPTDAANPTVLTKAKDALIKVTGNSETLSKLGNEQAELLKSQLKERLAQANSAFKAEADRIMKSDALAKLFGDSLKNVKLFG